MRQILDITKKAVLTLMVKKNLTTDETTGLLNLGVPGDDICETPKYLPLLTKDNWSFRLFSATFDKSYSNFKWTVVIVINSPYIYLPHDLFENLSNQVIGYFDEINDTYTVECYEAEEIFKNAALDIGSTKIVLNKEWLMDKFGLQCSLKIRKAKAETPDQWTLGRPFLNNKCTFLDYSGRIGFSNIKNV